MDAHIVLQISWEPRNNSKDVDWVEIMRSSDLFIDCRTGQGPGILCCRLSLTSAFMSCTMCKFRNFQRSTFWLGHSKEALCDQVFHFNWSSSDFATTKKNGIAIFNKAGCVWGLSFKGLGENCSITSSATPSSATSPDHFPIACCSPETPKHQTSKDPRYVSKLTWI